MDLKTIATALGGKPKPGGGYMARCPAHDDHNPSLSLDARDGRVVVKCFSGCTQTAVVDALKSKGIWPDHRVESTENHFKQKVVGRFDYNDADGKLLYWKERVEPGRGGKNKEFFFFHGRRQRGRGCNPMFYHLADVLKAKAVIFNEGEKQADLLKSWGLAASTLDSGSASRPTDEQVEQMLGKRAAILCDNDAAGRTYANNIASALHGKMESLKIVLLPGLPEKGNICDWAKDPGNDKARLLEIIRAAPEWTPATERIAATVTPAVISPKSSTAPSSGYSI